MIPEFASLLVGPTWLDTFAPVSLANAADVHESSRPDLLLVQIATEGMKIINPIEVRPQDLEELARLEPLVAFVSDREVHEALTAAGCTAGSVLPDGADPAMLWRVADRLGLTGWPLDPALRDDRILVAVDLARAAGLLPDLPRVAERRAALAALLVHEGLQSDDATMAVAQVVQTLAGLPSLALELLRAGHLALGPIPLDIANAALSTPPVPRRGRLLPGGQRRRAIVPDDGKALHLPETSADQGAERLAAPVILAPPPPSGEAAEQTALLRLQRLQLPVGAVPAPDPEFVRDRLRAAFPWFGTAIDALSRELALSRLGGGPARLPPLLLHGPPGSGKSRFSKALAEACGLPMRRIAGPDAGVVTVLAGNGRGWRAPQAAAPVEAIAALGVRNPLILVDDADRMPTGTHNGDPRAVLLAFLERGTALGYLDPLLAVPCDVAGVNWVLTANSIEPLGDALLDRLYRVEVPPPPTTAFDTVVAGMMADIATEYGIASGQLPGLPEDVWAALRGAFTNEGTALRRVARALRAALGAQASRADPLLAATEVLSAARAAQGRPIGFVRSSPSRA